MSHLGKYHKKLLLKILIYFYIIFYKNINMLLYQELINYSNSLEFFDKIYFK